MCYLIILFVIFFYDIDGVIIIALMCFHNFLFIYFSLIVIAHLLLNWECDKFNYFLLFLLLLLNLFCWDFFHDINWIIVGVSIYLWDLLFFYFLISYLSFSHLKSVLIYFNNLFVSKYSQPQLVFNHDIYQVMLFLLKRF